MIVPPWPSKTANKALPSPISTSWMAASYMFFLQPLSWFLYLAFQPNRKKSSLNYLSKCFFRYWVPTNIRPSIISEYNLNIISYLSISLSINNHSSHQPSILPQSYFSYPSPTFPSTPSPSNFFSTPETKLPRILQPPIGLCKGWRLSHDNLNIHYFLI